MFQDLKHACRELLKNRWFTCVTVLTLALGIGANTAIFGVVNRLLLNPLPYADSESIVFLRLGNDRVVFGFPTPGFVAHAWREEATSLAGIEAYELHNPLAYDDRGARIVDGMRITPGLPAFLGVAPILGRGFTGDDATAGAQAVVLLSYEAWQRDYGGEPGVVGRAITLDDVPHVVVGVMPARWDALASAPAELWMPLALDPAETGSFGFQVVEAVARLRADVPAEAARAELDVLVERSLASAQRQLFEDTVVTRLVPPSDRLGAGTREALLVLLGAVALLLLVACSNVANLMLARGAGRARELALKMALGAGAGRLVRALLAECLALAFAAGLVGLAFGWLTLRVVMALRPSSLPALADLTLDPAVLAFTFGVSALTALLFGLAPALQLRSSNVGDALRHGASGVVRRGTGARVRKSLVAAQMAISVVLLVSAGLVVRSVVHLQSVDVGFDTENLLTARLALPRAKYETATSREVLAEQLIERIETLPGVAGVTQTYVAPPNGVWSLSTEVETRGSPPRDANAYVTHGFNHVGANFFDILGIPLQGRTFAADEVRSGKVVIVNRAAAERYWPAGDAIGAEMRWGEPDWRTVVGVADNIIAGGLTRATDEPQFYFPFDVERVPMTFGSPPTVTLMVRAAEDPASVIAAVRAATQALDPEIAITNVLLTETAFAATIDGPRFNMALLTAFAVLALVLAAVGLAAVIGYEVAERTHEIGIRMALGARTENVRRLAMRHGLTPAFVGVVIGVVAALGATQLAASLLYGVTPRDPLTFVGVVALLVAVALGASWLPARRATRVEPIIALRAD